MSEVPRSEVFLFWVLAWTPALTKSTLGGGGGQEGQRGKGRRQRPRKYWGKPYVNSEETRNRKSEAARRRWQDPAYRSRVLPLLKVFSPGSPPPVPPVPLPSRVPSCCSSLCHVSSRFLLSLFDLPCQFSFAPVALRFATSVLVSSARGAGLS